MTAPELTALQPANAGPATPKPATPKPTTPELPPLSPFDELKVLIVTDDQDGVVSFFAGMPEKQRRALVKPLRAHLKTLSWRASDTDWSLLRERRIREGKPLLLAGVATAGTAGAVGKWIRDVRRETNVEAKVASVVRVLADRKPEWLADVPGAITDSLDWFSDISWRLAQGVAELSGTTPVATDSYVLAWAGGYRRDTGTQMRDRMRKDPLRNDFLARLFDIEEGGFFLSAWVARPDPIGTLLTEGSLDRAPLLDAVLARLLRGGRPGDMTSTMTYLDRLVPTDEEHLGRVATCISLLSSANGSVSRRFAGVLKDLSDRGLLDVELAVEAASIAVTRPEKNLVRTAFTWLDSLVTRYPDRAAEIVPALAAAFSAQSSDLQERAAKLVAKRARLLSEADRLGLADSGRFLLPADLAATLATALGVAEDAKDSAAAAPGYPEPAPYVPRPMPGPIATAAEAAEVFSALMWRGPDDPMTVERFLEAVVEFSRDDADALSAAFRPVVEQHPLNDWQRKYLAPTPRTAVWLLAEAVSGLDEKRVPHRATAETLWTRMHTTEHRRHWGSRGEHNGPLDILTMRIMELVAVIGAERMPSLLAVPTAANGVIDPAVLAERLRRAEAEGRRPLSVDFEQALLRLPRDCGAVDVSGLDGEHGKQFAAWVGGGRPELPTAVRAPLMVTTRWSRDPGLSLRSTRTPANLEAPIRMPKVDSLFAAARAVWDAPTWTEEEPSWFDCVPAILPANPDLVAVSLAPSAYAWGRGRAVATPALLAEADAPCQDALHFVIADRMTSGDTAGRAGAVDAALVLAARGLLDGALLGADLVSLLTTSESAGLRKVVPCLRDLANGGGGAQAWQAVAATVAGVLPPALPKSLPGTADLLALGTEIASTLGARGPIPAVAELAGRKGGGTVPAAARRLDSVLSAA